MKLWATVVLVDEEGKRSTSDEKNCTCLLEVSGGLVEQERVGRAPGSVNYQSLRRGRKERDVVKGNGRQGTQDDNYPVEGAAGGVEA